MVAFPPCFPGVTLPIPADECHITALDVAADGMVYAGTSGPAAHLLVGMFHGVTGMVLDMGVVEGATQTAAICCGQSQFVAAVNGPAGGRLVKRAFQPLPFDLIQEWTIGRMPFHDLGEVAPGESILHAVADANRQAVVGVTEGHLFVLDLEAAKVDGCNPFHTYWRIYMPLTKPAVTTLAVFVFMSRWNDLLGPLIYLNRPEKMTVTAGLSYFQGHYFADVPLLMAGSLVSILPTLILFGLAQRYFVQGVVLSGIKG